VLFQNKKGFTMTQDENGMLFSCRLEIQRILSLRMKEAIEKSPRILGISDRKRNTGRSVKW
jgi:hypothetical protein